MAKQRGIIKLEGTIGDITFHKSKDGYIAKEKGGVSAEKIANDPAFQRTRENGAEFGHAGKTSKILRTAFRSQLQRASDSRMVSRLTKEMMRVLQADMTSDRGKRNVADGELSFLFGFDFNVSGKLSTTLYAPYVAAINRITGACTVNLPAFVPANMVAAPSGTTHFKLFSAAAAVNFGNGVIESDAQETAVLPWDKTPTAVINLANQLTANSSDPLFLVLGIEFMQQVNGNQYPLKNGSFNALAIVQVDQ